MLAECEQIRVESLAAIEAHEYVEATELRDRERELLKKGLEPLAERQEEFLAEMRAGLGTAEP